MSGHHFHQTTTMPDDNSIGIGTDRTSDTPPLPHFLKHVVGSGCSLTLRFLPPRPRRPLVPVPAAAPSRPAFISTAATSASRTPSPVPHRRRQPPVVSSPPASAPTTKYLLGTEKDALAAVKAVHGAHPRQPPRRCCSQRSSSGAITASRTPSSSTHHRAPQGAHARGLPLRRQLGHRGGGRGQPILWASR